MLELLARPARALVVAARTCPQVSGSFSDQTLAARASSDRLRASALASAAAAAAFCLRQHLLHHRLLFFLGQRSNMRQLLGHVRPLRLRPEDPRTSCKRLGLVLVHRIALGISPEPDRPTASAPASGYVRATSRPSSARRTCFSIDRIAVGRRKASALACHKLIRTSRKDAFAECPRSSTPSSSPHSTIGDGNAKRSFPQRPSFKTFRIPLIRIGFRRDIGIDQIVDHLVRACPCTIICHIIVLHHSRMR